MGAVANLRRRSRRTKLAPRLKSTRKRCRKRHGIRKMRMTKSASVVALALLALLAAPASVQNVVAGDNVDIAGGIRVRVGVPYVARGPGAVADSWFTEFKLPDGRYRGFTPLRSRLPTDGNSTSVI